MNSELPPRCAPLPVRLRPCLGESANSYIRRLARANHLKPSFLHCYVCGPTQWFGKPLLENLATVADHSPEALERSLADANALRGTNRPRRRLPRVTKPHAHKALQPPLLGRWLRLGDPTRLTTTETGFLTDPITGELADLIESMISRRINGRQIWTELIDHHDYLGTYDSIPHYIRYIWLRTA
ncbi:hypothetical protein ACFYP6_29165 [Streptomyces goshikiensis]|uniref:hypothetical protein n=1 Tax=Streptomyces goshikiensis TaxID=1942 RepID=UPI003684F3DF